MMALAGLIMAIYHLLLYMSKYNKHNDRYAYVIITCFLICSNSHSLSQDTASSYYIESKLSL